MTSKKVIRSRKDMVNYLFDNSRYIEGLGKCLFCFNVKLDLFNFPFSFMSIYQEMLKNNPDAADWSVNDFNGVKSVYYSLYGVDRYMSNRDYDNQTIDKYNKARDAMLNVAMEMAQSDFINNDGYDQLITSRNGFKTSTEVVWDGKKTIYSGGVCVDVVDDPSKTFGGKSSGYAIYTRVMGHSVAGVNYQDCEGGLNETWYDNPKQYVIPFEDIRMMYQFHVKMKRELNSNTARDMVLFYLADIFYSYLLEELPNRSYWVENY